MTRETATLPLDNGGQGCFHASMDNQRHSDGEPPVTGNASVRRPEAVGEPQFPFREAVDQPCFRDVSPRRREDVPTWAADVTAQEMAALALQSIECLEEVPVPPRGLPGAMVGYNPDAHNLVLLGIEYLQCWLRGETRRMVNINREVAGALEKAYRVGREAERNAIKSRTATDVEPMPATWREEQADAALVYFIHSESGGIKIGMALDPIKRLKTLQTAHPVKLSILATCLGGQRQERAYHERFAAHRLHGEWFAPHADILAEIERLSPDKSRTVCSAIVLGGAA